MTRTSKRRITSLKELAEQGIPVDVSVADVDIEDKPTPGLEIEQVGWEYQSRIFELSNGLTGYMLELDITNQTSRTLYPCYVELPLSWEDLRFDWMLDPREEDFYSFGKNSLELPSDQVINHVLLSEKGLKPKRPLQGSLLAIGGPMPQNLRHGQWIEPTLTITTSDHAEWSLMTSLWVERLEDRPTSQTRKRDVYGQPAARPRPH